MVVHPDIYGQVVGVVGDGRVPDGGGDACGPARLLVVGVGLAELGAVVGLYHGE